MLLRLVCLLRGHRLTLRVYRCSDKAFPDVSTSFKLLPPIYRLIAHECSRCGAHKEYRGPPP